MIEISYSDVQYVLYWWYLVLARPARFQNRSVFNNKESKKLTAPDKIAAGLDKYNKLINPCSSLMQKSQHGSKELIQCSNKRVMNKRARLEKG